MPFVHGFWQTSLFPDHATFSATIPATIYLRFDLNEDEDQDSSKGGAVETG